MYNVSLQSFIMVKCFVKFKKLALNVVETIYNRGFNLKT
jgi:hypothetical protein